MPAHSKKSKQLRQRRQFKQLRAPKQKVQSKKTRKDVQIQQQKQKEQTLNTFMDTVISPIIVNDNTRGKKKTIGKKVISKGEINGNPFSAHHEMVHFVISSSNNDLMTTPLPNPSTISPYVPPRAVTNPFEYIRNEKKETTKKGNQTKKWSQTKKGNQTKKK